jgi:hypothetical protein
MAANVEDFKSESVIEQIKLVSLQAQFSVDQALANMLFVRSSHLFLHLYRFSERLDEQDLHIRESWVAAMKARIVRGELIKCQRGEGVNHYKHCRELAEMYTGMIRENKVSTVVEDSLGALAMRVVAVMDRESQATCGKTVRA